MAFISRHAVLVVIGLVFLAAAIGYAVQNGRDIDMDQQSISDPRYNRTGTPPTGLKQNPGRPQTERPAERP